MSAVRRLWLQSWTPRARVRPGLCPPPEQDARAGAAARVRRTCGRACEAGSADAGGNRPLFLDPVAVSWGWGSDTAWLPLRRQALPREGGLSAWTWGRRVLGAALPTTLPGGHPGRGTASCKPPAQQALPLDHRLLCLEGPHPSQRRASRTPEDVTDPCLVSPPSRGYLFTTSQHRML